MRGRGQETGGGGAQHGRRLTRFLIWLFVISLAPRPSPLAPCWAGQAPSFFRGVVVADSPLGVRVVSVEEFSQAAQADLRPEDIIARVQDQEIHSIDNFGAISNALKGRALSATLVVFRNGTPREVTLHLYSYPVQRAWNVEFIPDHDVRFAQPQTGLAYWSRLGRGFEEARKDAEALNAYLNGLHNVPEDLPTALKAVELMSRLGQQHLTVGRLTEGVTSLSRALAMMDRLFEHPLTDEQLTRVRDQLRATVEALKQASQKSPR